MIGAPSAWSGSARVTVSSLPSPNDPPASVTATTRRLVAATVVSSSVAYTSTVSPGRSRPSTARSRPSVIDTSGRRLAAHLVAHGPELEQLPVADRRHEHPALELGRRVERGPRHPGGQVHRHEADRVGASRARRGPGRARPPRRRGRACPTPAATRRTCPRRPGRRGRRPRRRERRGCPGCGRSPAPAADPAGPSAPRLLRQVASSPSHVVSPVLPVLPSAPPSPPHRETVVVTHTPYVTARPRPGVDRKVPKHHARR